MTERSGGPARLRQRAVQFLVHCFLYYRLNESVISDEEFDRLAGELRKLRAENPDEEMPYADTLDPVLGAQASGFQIRHYPPRIVTMAFKLLYAETNPGVDFREFVERRGYRLEMGEGGAP
jgi:NAD-dependent DNA ligase